MEALWEKDLVRLEAGLDACDADDAKEAEEAARLVKKNMTGEDFLVNRQCVLILTSNFECKRVPAMLWKAKRKGKVMDTRMVKDKKEKDAEGQDEEGEDVDDGAEEEEKEALSGVFCCHDFDALLVFSEDGMCFALQALDVPLAKKVADKGKSLKDFLPELGDRKIASIVTVDQKALKEQTEDFVVLLSTHGYAKKITVDKFRGLRAGRGVVAMTLKDGDTLKWAHRASGQNALVIATASGLILRCSLGADWLPTGSKSMGNIAMKVKAESDDWIAACAITNLSDQEIRSYKKLKELRSAKRQQMMAAAGGPFGVAASTADAAETAEGLPLKAQTGDDDSENGDVDGKAAAPGASPALDDAGEASDGDNADADEPESDGEKPAKAEGAGEEGSEPDETGGTKDDDQCILVVTEQGMGLRVHLSAPRIKLRRRGGCGLRCIKLTEGRNPDNVVAICCVSNKQETAKPQRPRLPHVIYLADKRAQQQAEEAAAAEEAAGQAVGEAAAEEIALPPPSPALPAPPSPTLQVEPAGFAAHRARKLEAEGEFQELPEEKKAPYLARSEEEKRVYDAAMEEYRKDEAEEVLLGTEKGSISRVKVGSVPVVVGARKGKCLVKVHKNDLLCTVSLLSSVDEVDDDGHAKPATPAPSRPTRPRAPTQPELAGAAGSSSTAPEAATEGPPTTRRRLEAGAAASAPSQAAASQESAPSQAVQQRMLMSPKANDGKRMRGKTTSPAVEHLRSRLSDMAMPLRRSSSRLSEGKKGVAAQSTSRLSIVKSKLRLLSKTRKTLIVRSLDVNQWAALAAAAAAVKRR